MRCLAFAYTIRALRLVKVTTKRGTISLKSKLNYMKGFFMPLCC